MTESPAKRAKRTTEECTAFINYKHITSAEFVRLLVGGVKGVDAWETNGYFWDQTWHNLQPHLVSTPSMLSSIYRLELFFRKFNLKCCEGLISFLRLLKGLRRLEIGVHCDENLDLSNYLSEISKLPIDTIKIYDVDKIEDFPTFMSTWEFPTLRRMDMGSEFPTLFPDNCVQKFIALNKKMISLSFIDDVCDFGSNFVKTSLDQFSQLEKLKFRWIQITHDNAYRHLINSIRSAKALKTLEFDTTTGQSGLPYAACKFAFETFISLPLRTLVLLFDSPPSLSSEECRDIIKLIGGFKGTHLKCNYLCNIRDPEPFIGVLTSLLLDNRRLEFVWLWIPRLRNTINYTTSRNRFGRIYSRTFARPLLTGAYSDVIINV